MKERYRLFSLVLYKETDTYDIKEVLTNIKSYKYYAYALHDKDLKEDLTLKKEHYHIVLKLDNATTISALSKKIGVPENYIQHIRNERAFVRYLIHFDDEEKYQYNLEDIKTSRSYQRFVSKCFEDKETEEEIINNINNFIYNLKGTPRQTALFNLIAYVNLNCYDTIFKRYRQEFTNILNLTL